VTFDGNSYIMRDYDDTNTGWVTVTVPLGNLSSGSHAVTIGGVQNARAESAEVTTIAFDDIGMTNLKKDRIESFEDKSRAARPWA